ncbi:hypothetical protein MMC25_006945 [Agyrium rufum]|nr:hypothetical protein [Agyrium rufum]
MNASRVLRATHRTPLIKFVGKRSPPASVDHTPAPHPASPSHSLPDSFANYRSKAQQHGPLGGQQKPPALSGSAGGASHAYGAVGGHSGRSLGSVKPAQGLYFDRSELPKRFGRTPMTEAEIEAVETGGASLFG